MPVAELQSRMTSAEFQEWRAYYQIEPFGDLRADFRSGILCSIVSNLMLGKDDEPATPMDFVIHDDRGAETELAAGDDLDDDEAAKQARIDAISAAEADRMFLTLERYDRLKHGNSRPT